MVKKNLDEVKKKKKIIDKAIMLDHLKAEESSKIVKEELIQKIENPEDKKDNLIKINPMPKAEAEERNDLKANDKDRSDLWSLPKNEFTKEIEVNPVKDNVELKNIDWKSNSNLIRNDNNNENFSQTSSNFRLSDTLNMKRIEKSYQINHEIPDVSNVKSKIDTGLRRNRDSINNFNKTGMMNNFLKKNDDNNGKISFNPNKLEDFEYNQDEEAHNYQKLEKDNKNELKQFIQTVMAGKREKRNNYFDQNNVSGNLTLI